MHLYDLFNRLKIQLGIDWTGVFKKDSSIMETVRGRHYGKEKENEDRVLDEVIVSAALWRATAPKIWSLRIGYT
ncbi:hypothetical protein ZYGR_0AD04060 [Zygosaccharomyces rouxii]|uniref:ZYRO0G15510p n=2 Tax=Zygosaccharomyces rouxii TaxID=4956 RepID=C5E0T8_ZYGRC|nr:uncharacterized protein ZYRO0G15510g [Zygosaccharomyces rouxii]GAV51223.1 hypothetical protein ZYGR_0AD04060 [Zygosaccharomyces rouxii]CAR29722.1 ZYRO0G15510p [Zygosaccharomyces rouxii]